MLSAAAMSQPRRGCCAITRWLPQPRAQNPVLFGLQGNQVVLRACPLPVAPVSFLIRHAYPSAPIYNRQALPRARDRAVKVVGQVPARQSQDFLWIRLENDQGFPNQNANACRTVAGLDSPSDGDFLCHRMGKHLMCRQCRSFRAARLASVDREAQRCRATLSRQPAEPARPARRAQ